MNLLYRNEEDAIESLFRCYAKILRELRTGKIKKANDQARFQTANDGLRGLSHCLRWIRQCCPSALIVTAPQRDQDSIEAMELLRWGVQYDPIFGEHSAYRGNLVKFDLDESTRTITFPPRYDVDPQFFCSQIEARKADDQRQSNDCPEETLSQLSKIWFDSVRITNRGLHFDDAKIGNSGAIDIAVRWMNRTCLPELVDTIKLHGCTVADLRRVLAGLYVYSLFLTRFEDVTDDHPNYGFILEPHVVSGSKDEIVYWLANLSGVNESSVEAIVSTLTFDANNQHVTLGQQPFSCSKNGRMFLLPRLIMAISLSLPKMYISAINRSEDGRKVYGNVINVIEVKGVQALAGNLRQILPSHFQITTQQQYSLPDGRDPIKPDIVIFTKQNEVLVIDVKHSIPPFGPLDIRYDIKEMEVFKQRMSEYVTAFLQYSDILAQHFKGTTGTMVDVFGLILLRWPFPIPVDFQSPICAVDWPSLKQHVENAKPNSVSEVFNWANSRPDLHVPQNLEWTPREVKAGIWTYRYFELTSPS